MNVGGPKPKQYLPREPTPHKEKKRKRKRRKKTGTAARQARTRFHAVSGQQTRLRYISRSSPHHEPINKKRSAIKIDTRSTLNPEHSLGELMQEKPGVKTDRHQSSLADASH